MKPQLTLKHLAPYLPYRLKVQYVDSLTNRKKKAILTQLGYDCIETTHRMYRGCKGDIISWEGYNSVNDMQIKPILRPLSDLTKEIEHNGKKFIPLSELFKLSKGNFQQEIKYHSVMATNQIQLEMLGFRNYFFGLYESNRDVRIDNGLYFDCYSTDLVMNNRIEEKILCQYSLFVKLFEWHFDIFGLIPEGLAIDINTL